MSCSFLLLVYYDFLPNCRKIQYITVRVSFLLVDNWLRSKEIQPIAKFTSSKKNTKWIFCIGSIEKNSEL